MAGACPVEAGDINVPNHSFESPAAPFPSPIIESWQKTERPDDYDEGGGFLWSQLTGTFKNTAPGSSDHIDNCDGDQALWLFVVPEVGLFQDYDSVGGMNTEPAHDFDARFAVGKSYRLTVGVIGGGGGMLEGASLRISLFYRDGSSNRVMVAATNIIHSTNLFPATTHFVDIELQTPPVETTSAWAGRHIGIEFLSTVTTNLEGGYWDLDNVRLSELTEPFLHSPAWTNGDGFTLTLESEPGIAFEILASTNATLTRSNWTSIGTLTNTSGSATFTDTTAGVERRFYSARQMP